MNRTIAANMWGPFGWVTGLYGYDDRPTMIVMSTHVIPLTPRGRHNEPMHPDDLRAAITRYEQATEEAREERDNTIRAAKKSGMPQKEIVEATGYTRETIRRILDPDAAEAVRQAAAERRRQRKQAS